MNLFDNAKWLNISDFKKLDDELLNYIDYIYNEFPKLHYTDEEWTNIIKRDEKCNNKDISQFMQKYAKLYNNSINISISMCTFIKYDTDRLKSIIKKLSIKQIYYILRNVDLIESIFMQKYHIKSLFYLFNRNYEQLYQQYIHIRIINPIRFEIISYVLSKYFNDDSTDFYRFIDDLLVDFYNRQNYVKVSDEIYLISDEYVQKMQPFAYNLYDYYVQRFVTSPDRLMLTFLLDYNIKPIDNENALKIIDFVKKQNCILTKELLNTIIASCNLATEQINELKALNLLSNI